MSNPDDERGRHADTVVQKRYIAQVRVRVHSEEIEEGYDPSDWDDRAAAEIQSEDHVREYREINAPTLNQALDALEGVNLREVAENGE